MRTYSRGPVYDPWAKSGSMSAFTGTHPHPRIYTLQGRAEQHNRGHINPQTRLHSDQKGQTWPLYVKAWVHSEVKVKMPCGCPRAAS